MNTNASNIYIYKTLSSMIELYSKPGTWTQGANAKDKDGYSTTINEDRAVSWCMNGAICLYADINQNVLNPETGDYLDKFMSYYPSKYPTVNFVCLNDEVFKTQDEVLQFLKDARDAFCQRSSYMPPSEA